MTWAWIAVLVISAIVQWLTRPKPPDAPKPEQAEITTAEEGKPIPVAFGRVLIKSSNIVWYGNVELSPIKRKGGKKG